MPRAPFFDRDLENQILAVMTSPVVESPQRRPKRLGPGKTYTAENAILTALGLPAMSISRWVMPQSSSSSVRSHGVLSEIGGEVAGAYVAVVLL